MERPRQLEHKARAGTPGLRCLAAGALARVGMGGHLLSVPDERVWRNVARATFRTTVRIPFRNRPLMHSIPHSLILGRRQLLQRLLVAPLVAALVSASACGSDDPVATSSPSNPATETFASSLGINIASMTKKSDDLYIKDLVVGTGSEAINGRLVRVHYTGWTANGTQFETSAGRSPIEFTLGQDVITGWNQGILGMRVGGKRRLVIGSNLAYGSTGKGSIPPNATLIFDVELVGVQ